MTGKTCKTCGSSELDVDPSRGDTVCTNCGTVLEDSVIVSEIQFEESAHGVNSAIGQFVAADSSGGCRGFGNNFHSGIKESKEVTLKNAKKGLSHICDNLRLNQHCLDTAFNFYKMALSRHLTRGRKQNNMLAACLYITCRLEGTPHLLIDFSELLQICAFELGRTCIKLSQALCINIPTMDPCLYVLRFCNDLQFGDKVHEVSMTALRLVQRMKRDSIHTGRRPSGICGAALLVAARLHNFNRTVADIVKVVQVHESTLRRRLVEFGETPSSCLTLKEFMSIDLEEEQDPPAYKSSMAKDNQRLKVMENPENLKQFTELQLEIESFLAASSSSKKFKKRKLSFGADTCGIEDSDTDKFVVQSTIGTIQNILSLQEESEASGVSTSGLGPSIATLGFEETAEKPTNEKIEKFIPPEDGELDLTGIDDGEIDMYIMDDEGAKFKDNLWTTMHSEYLKEKEERLKKEKEEGKVPEKRKKHSRKRQEPPPANSAGEAMEKMLQEKKISAKINYDVLKTLSDKFRTDNEEEDLKKIEIIDGKEVTKEDVIRELKNEPSISNFQTPSRSALREPKPKKPAKEQAKVEPVSATAEEEPIIAKTEEYSTLEAEDNFDDELEEAEPTEEGEGMMSVAQMLRQHHNSDHDYFSDTYDDDYY